MNLVGYNGKYCSGHPGAMTSYRVGGCYDTPGGFGAVGPHRYTRFVLDGTSSGHVIQQSWSTAPGCTAPEEDMLPPDSQSKNYLTCEGYWFVHVQ